MFEVNIRQLIEANHFAAPLVSFALSVGLGFLARWIAVKFSIRSRIDLRRQDTTTTPLLGGASIFATLVIVSILFQSLMPPIYLLLPVAIIFCAGLLDDVVELKAPAKFFLEFAAVALWLWQNRETDLLFSRLGMSPISSLVLSVVWILTITNAVNLIDGLDGVAGGFATLAAVVLGLVLTPFSADQIFLFCVGGTSLGFLCHNFPKARMYLGDSGSLTLGFLLSTISLTTQSVISTPDQTLVGILMLFAFPEIDLLLAFGRRIINGRSPFCGDRQHLHHRLMRCGLSVNQTLALLTTVVTLNCLTALFIQKISIENGIFVTILMTGALVFALVLFYFVETRFQNQMISMTTNLIVQSTGSRWRYNRASLATSITIPIRAILSGMPALDRSVLISFSIRFKALVHSRFTNYRTNINSANDIELIVDPMTSQSSLLDFQTEIQKIVIEHALVEHPSHLSKLVLMHQPFAISPAPQPELEIEEKTASGSAVNL